MLELDLELPPYLSHSYCSFPEPVTLFSISLQDPPIQGAQSTFYYQYQAAKAGIDPNVGAEIETLQEENKHRFVELAGWDRVAQDEQLLARVKALGLAPVNQERLAQELRQFFSQVVWPNLETAVREAEANQIFIREKN